MNDFANDKAALLSVPTRFDNYEISGMKRLNRGRGQKDERVGPIVNDSEQVADEEAEFWSLFGHISGQGLDCIGDYATREHAEEIFARITGRSFNSKQV